MKKSYWVKHIVSIFLALVGLLPTGSSFAQQVEPDGPIYIVQEGDSLWDIALRFRVSIDDLAGANGINDPSQIKIGDRLVIPGLEGIQGILTTRNLDFGETLNSLSRRYQVPKEVLIQLNHVASPDELYVGSTLVIPELEDRSGQTTRAILMLGQSLLELAVAGSRNPWSYVVGNHLTASWSALPGDVLHLPDISSNEENTNQPGALPEVFSAIELKPTPLVQGKTTVLRVSGPAGLSLGGSLNDAQLHFFTDENGDYFSFQGIHAMAEPGLSTLTITGTLLAGAPYYSMSFSFSQSVLIRSGEYPFDPVLVVSPETIDPAVTKPEDAQWAALAAPFTPDKLWDGIFQSPAPPPFSDCWPSQFGNRRSYNGSPYIYFHSGLDFCGGVGTEILAPAAGKVVFAGPLTVRGNATLIDHGWGIYSGYLHQTEILVKVGERVAPGQVIGLVGGTGRVTGPHLHWEVWAGGIQVDPLDWLEQIYP